MSITYFFFGIVVEEKICTLSRLVIGNGGSSSVIGNGGSSSIPAFTFTYGTFSSWSSFYSPLVATTT